jgi:DNA-binding PadR family transcriptional regulator
MYELIVLSLLMRWPMHGYLIVKVTNDQIGPWAKISSGTLYTILARLEETGMIIVVPQEHGSARGDRRSRTFAITQEGRKRFHQVMMDTSSNLGDYQRIFNYKYAYLDLLRPHERMLLLNHYLNYCQTTILHLQTEREALRNEVAANPAFLERLIILMTHQEQQWQQELEWARAVREREAAASDVTNATNSDAE